MNDQLRKMLLAIFTRPFSAAVGLEDLKHLLSVLGADIDDRPDDRLYVTLNGRTASFRRGDDALPPEEVVLIKQFLEQCGVVPAAFTR